MIDKKWIGHTFPPFTIEVEASKLAFFAKAVNETNPIYTQEEAAQAAGYPTIPAPPTFAFSLNIASPLPYEFLAKLGINLGRVLHGEQKFEYYQPIFAGDTLSLVRTIKDIYEKKDGKLEFIVDQIFIQNQKEELLGKMLITSVILH